MFMKTKDGCLASGSHPVFKTGGCHAFKNHQQVRIWHIKEKVNFGGVIVSSFLEKNQGDGLFSKRLG